MKGCSRKRLYGRRVCRPVAARLSTFIVAILIAFVPVWHLFVKEARAGTYIRKSIEAGPPAGSSGRYTIVARASDRAGAKVSGKIKADREPPSPPLPKQPPQIKSIYPDEADVSDLRVGSSILFVVTAYDPTPYAYLNYTWYVDGSPKGNDASFMYAPSASDIGTHKVEVKVSNGTLASSNEWSVTVRDFKISVSAGQHGSISPSAGEGGVSVAPGSEAVFTIKPDSCYRIGDVVVDGNSVGTVDSYKFSDIADDHSIGATFVPAPAHTIVAEAKENGTISPSGPVEVKCGDGATFNIKANPHYEVGDILVDSVPVGAVSTYTFKNVEAGHTISASFVRAPVIDVVGTEHGSVSPSGKIKVRYLSDQTFTITPDLGYLISDVLVDGASVGAVESYTFKGVSNDHKLAAIFVQNDPPAADAGPNQRVEQGADVVLSALNSTDPDDSISSYKWEQTGGPAVTLSNPAAAQTSFTAPQAAPAALTFEVTVTDAGGMQATDTCIVNVVRDRESRPPVAKAGFDQTASEGDTVELDGSGSYDFNGGIASYSWEQTAGPTMALSDPSSPQPRFTVKDLDEDEDSALVFKLTVTDRAGLKSTDYCTVNVSSEDDPPTAAVGADQNVSEGATVVLDGSKSSASDSGDIATYVWKQVAGPPVKLSSPDDAKTSFAAPRVGPEGEFFTFRLTVIDEGDLRSSSTTTVFVAHPLSITAPNGGEVWHAGDVHTISWNFTETEGAKPDLMLELLKGGHLASVISDTVPMGAFGAGSFEWTIPETLEPGNDYTIRIEGKNGKTGENSGATGSDGSAGAEKGSGPAIETASYSDTSNGSFTITEPAPTPEFSAAPLHGTAPVEVRFSDSSTGTVTSRLWDFGDGATSSEKDPVHKYESTGVYTVSLKVEGPGGSCTETKPNLIDLGDKPPVAAFSASERSGPPPLKVSFKDESEGGATSWSWDFGDGNTSGEQNPTHTYASSGSYQVTLKIEGPGGSNEKTLKDYVRVDAIPYAAAFSADPRSGEAPLKVSFKDESNGEIKSWHWKFGDGKTSDEQNPVHIYTSAGNFTVELTVRGADGINAEIKPKFISVERSHAAPARRPSSKKRTVYRSKGIKIYIPPAD